MDRRLRRSVVALAGALVALAPLVLPFASPAEARSRGGVAGACRDDTGITVVVDQRAFGGAVEVRCAPQPVASGFQALAKAGFTYAGAVQFPGLLCRIDGQPASDPCRGAPPAKAYWGYWHADRGGSWTYSTAGANRTPPPGSVEGWAFGDKARPGTDPPDPFPTPTTLSAPSPPSSAPSTGGAAATPPSTATPSSTTSAPSGDQPSPAAGVPSPSVAAQGSDEVAAPAEVGGAVGVDPPDPGAGSPMALLVTGALVAAAGVFAVQQRRARRRG